MDQDAFRDTYREANIRGCAFEKSVQNGRCRCSHSETICIAERQGIGCDNDERQQLCLELLEVLRHQSRFALKIHDEHMPLMHSASLRVQIGGLRGLHSALYPDDEIPAMIADISELVADAKERWDGFDELPFQAIIKQIAAFEGRHGR